VFSPNIEIIKAPLPHVPRLYARLACIPFATMDRTRKLLFDYFHHYRRIASLRLADEEVDVFGHHHVADDDKTVSLPRPFQDIEKQIAALGCTQHGQPMVATTGNKMQVFCAVISFKLSGHEYRLRVLW
jgi:hypothetical protein